MPVTLKIIKEYKKFVFKEFMDNMTIKNLFII